MVDRSRGREGERKWCIEYRKEDCASEIDSWAGESGFEAVARVSRVGQAKESKDRLMIV
jgi:hypothetical protein